MHYIFATLVSSDPGEPKTYKEVMSSLEAEGWRISIGSEFMNFLKRGSWKKKLRSDVKRLGRKIIGTKLVFKKKDEQDGTVRLKTRAVTKGYLQIPGVDFTESFSPVAADTTIRVAISITLYYDDCCLLYTSPSPRD